MLDEYFYITRAGNLEGILQKGILSRSGIAASGGRWHDISNLSVQNWRCLPDPVFNRPINSYTPLYINPRNPMLYAVSGRHDDLIILGVSPEALDHHEHLFTDGNAACKTTRFSTEPTVLADSYKALTAKYWTDIADGKRRRMAEVLVHPTIEPRFIARVHCPDTGMAKELAGRYGLNAVANPSLFF